MWMPQCRYGVAGRGCGDAPVVQSLPDVIKKSRTADTTETLGVIAQKLEIPDHLVTFQVMRRTLGTNLQHHGTLKDAQGALRHASIQTTGDVYVQTIEKSVLNAMNFRTVEILARISHRRIVDLGELGRRK